MIALQPDLFRPEIYKAVAAGQQGQGMLYSCESLPLLLTCVTSLCLGYTPVAAVALYPHDGPSVAAPGPAYGLVAAPPTPHRSLPAMVSNNAQNAYGGTPMIPAFNDVVQRVAKRSGHGAKLAVNHAQELITINIHACHLYGQKHKAIGVRCHGLVFGPQTDYLIAVCLPWNSRC